MWSEPLQLAQLEQERQVVVWPNVDLEVVQVDKLRERRHVHTILETVVEPQIQLAKLGQRLQWLQMDMHLHPVHHREPRALGEVERHHRQLGGATERDVDDGFANFRRHVPQKSHLKHVRKMPVLKSSLRGSDRLKARLACVK